MTQGFKMTFLFCPDPRLFYLYGACDIACYIFNSIHDNFIEVKKKIQGLDKKERSFLNLMLVNGVNFYRHKPI